MVAGKRYVTAKEWDELLDRLTAASARENRACVTITAEASFLAEGPFWRRDCADPARQWCS